MKPQKQRLLSDDWAALTKQLAAGKTQPAAVPSVLPLKSIRVWPGVFQHRNRRGSDSEGHVRILTTAIRHSPTKTVDPITVWWDGKGWACIDGHHRIDAYKAATSGSHSVPVQVFTGSIGQAMAEAASTNTKNKLAMVSAEKSNAAWRLVVVSDLTKAETANAAGISERTVATMRSVHAQLKVRKPTSADELTARVGEVDLVDLSWPDAKRLADGRDKTDFDWEKANRQKAEQWASALVKSFGKEAGKYPEVLAMALDIYDSRLMDRLVDWWSDRSDDDGDDAVEPPVGVDLGF